MSERQAEGSAPAARVDPGLREERQALRRLADRSDRHGLIQLGLHLAALAGTGALVLGAGGGPLALPAMLLHGVVLVFLFAPLHETVHRTAFRTRRLNDAVAFLCGLVVVLPPTWFRAFHFAHHRYTQDPARDPELKAPKPRTLWQWCRHVSGLPYWRERLSTTVRQASGRVDDDFVAPRDRPRVVFEARCYLLIYALVAVLALFLGSARPLLLWLVPVLLAQPLLRLYLLAEHTGCPLVADMFRNTRTTITTRLVRRLAWNMPFHAEHHAYPAVPFHALPRAHALLEGRLMVRGDGYVAVNREIVRDLERRRAALASG